MTRVRPKTVTKFSTPEQFLNNTDFTVDELAEVAEVSLGELPQRKSEGGNCDSSPPLSVKIEKINVEFGSSHDAIRKLLEKDDRRWLLGATEHTYMLYELPSPDQDTEEPYAER
jgi:hypothetical protein